MNEVDKLGWLCIKNKQLLCARSKGKDLYYIPGGKREKGESDEEALIREIKEEISVDLLPATIKYVGAFKAQAHGKPVGVMVKIICYFSDFVGEIKANAEIEEVIWLKYVDEPKCSPVTRIIMEYLKSEAIIE